MNLLILLPVLFPIIGAFIVYAFKDNNRKLKNIIVSILVGLSLLSSIVICFMDDLALNVLKISDALSISFTADGLAKFFTVAISFVWLLVTIYTFEYIKHEKNENRFYTFSLTTLAMLLALSYSNNLFTMYLSFELVTLLSMPLVLHSLSNESINAAKKYLFYSIGGAFVALFGLFLLISYSGDLPFSSFGGHELFANFEGNKTLYEIGVFMLIVGFATKGGMFPLHGWLPTAHPVAPSPASALLSGVITKAGVICIIRVVYYFVGPSFIESTWVQYAWLSLATFTVFLGSLMAFLEKTFKKRLAFSTVSQVSYILCGLALLNDVSFTGALLHVASHMLIKVCLFLFAGKVIYKYDYHKVDELKGIGKKMPIATWAYTFASLGLIGIPLTSGFISKWYLANGALSSNVSVFNYLVCIVLLVSAIFTAGYLLPITINGFIVSGEKVKKDEEAKLMVVPMVILAALILLIGINYQPLLEIISSIIGK